MPSTRTSYQQGSLIQVPRANSPAVWVYRWRELQPDGSRIHRKKAIGDVKRYPKFADAKRATEVLRAEINAKETTGDMTVKELWGHFAKFELRDPDVDRSPTTIELYEINARLHILPKWGPSLLGDVKAVAVEKWLRSLAFAPGTKAKLRNQMSALFSHAVRHELYGRNPIESVRQGAVRQKIPVILTLDQMCGILARLTAPEHRLAVLIAAVEGLRRSEMRGLHWTDIDQEQLWIHLRRGMVGKHQTKLKTEGSRRGVPMPEALAAAFADWRSKSLYPGDNDWVFASVERGGKTPMWFDIMMTRHIKPAALAAGVTGKIGWHTFRRSLASLLAAKREDVKVVQELLRHAHASTTQDLYQQGDVDAKRAAQAHTSTLFVVKKAG
jgi:integrase